MKKMLVSWMVVMITSQIVYADSQESRLSKLSKNIKSKVEQAKDSTKAFTVATIAYCKDRLHKLREPNYVVIDNAVQAMNTLQQVQKSVQLGVHSEIELLGNIQALGFDKNNALQALLKCNNMYYALAAFEKRYNGLLTPWNRSKKMQHIASSAIKSLKNAELYKLYFDTHNDCLQVWELCEKYQVVIDMDMNDPEIVASVLQNLCQKNDKYFLVHGVELLEKDIATCKQFVKDLDYRVIYAQAYAQTQVVNTVLENLHAVVKNSIEYKKQISQQVLDAKR